MIYIDQKFTIWERFSIEDENKEALESFLKENPQASSLDIYDWAHEQGLDPHCEMLHDLQEALEPQDNGGEATLEITQGMETNRSSSTLGRSWEIFHSNI